MEKKEIILLGIIYVFLGFWGLIDPPRWYMYVCLVPCLFSFLYVFTKTRISSILGSRLLFAFIVSLIINLVFSYLNRHQDPVNVLRNQEFLGYLYFLLFFVFILIRPSKENILNIIKYSYFTFLVCFFLEYFVFFPTPIFKLLSFRVDQYRFRMIGEIIGFVGYFYYLNKSLLNRSISYVDIIASLLGLLFIFLLGFRIHILATLLATLYLIIRIRGISYNLIKYVVAISIFFMIVLSTEYGTSALLKMIERQETQVLSNDDYVRVVQWKYFTNHHFVSVTDYLFGSGIPSEPSEYFHLMNRFNQYNMNTDQISFSPTQWRDWGLVGLSWVMGLPVFFVLLFFIGYMIFKKVPVQYLFISATYLELLISGVFTIEFYREGAYVFHALMLYLMYKLCLSNKIKGFKGRLI